MSPDIKSFDRVADVYDQTRGLPPEVERAVARGIAVILRSVAPSPRLVEVGVGTGRIAVPLAAEGVRVTGIDISPKMLARLREKRRDIDVMLAEASRPPLRPGVFDGALFVHILHLVPDAEATVRATLPLLRAGGVAIEAGDAREQSVREEADAAIARAVFDLSGVRMGGRQGDDRGSAVFARVAREAGATVEEVTLTRWAGSSTARKMLERLARRDYSSSWQIPDGVLPAVIERVTPEIERLYGDLDREIEFPRSFRAAIARLPGA